MCQRPKFIDRLYAPLRFKMALAVPATLLRDKEKSPKKNTALISASSQGDFWKVKRLLIEGASVNETGSFGTTALIRAAANGHNSIVELLLQHKAHFNIQDDFGDSPLMEASIGGHVWIVKELLHRGAITHYKGTDYMDTLERIAYSDRNSALHHAAISGYHEIVQLLLQYQADPNISNKYGSTPLLMAAEGCHVYCMEYLLIYGADYRLAIDGRTKVKQNLLLTSSRKSIWLLKAAQTGCFHIAKLMLEKGHVNPNVRAENGNTPLIYAADGRLHRVGFNRHSEIMQLLLKHGGDASLKNKRNQSANDYLKAQHIHVSIILTSSYF